MVLGRRSRNGYPTRGPFFARTHCAKRIPIMAVIFAGQIGAEITPPLSSCAKCRAREHYHCCSFIVHDSAVTYASVILRSLLQQTNVALTLPNDSTVVVAPSDLLHIPVPHSFKVGGLISHCRQVRLPRKSSDDSDCGSREMNALTLCSARKFR